jgi:molybdopterin-guanine dinucleotide biosynthesis protein A
MAGPKPLKIGGYVLAGGKSSRMGRDKALLELAGKPFAQHAVAKLRRVCEEVQILSGNPALRSFAPLVPDLHESIGPLGGMEAGLTHSPYDWNLFMPIDMPFLPSALLHYWMRHVVLSREGQGARIAMFSVDGAPQPALCLLHRVVSPFISRAIETGQYKVLPVLEGAARALTSRGEVISGNTFVTLPWNETSTFSTGSAIGEPWRTLTETQRAAKHMWFANLNTPEEFAEAEKHIEALDT